MQVFKASFSLIIIIIVILQIGTKMMTNFSLKTGLVGMRESVQLVQRQSLK